MRMRRMPVSRRAAGMICLLGCVVTMLGLSSCARTAGEGMIDLTKAADSIGGTASITKEGAKIDATARSGLITVGGLALPIDRKGIVRFNYKNTSDIEELKLQFTTQADAAFTPFKEVAVPIEKADGFREATVDVSQQYGWLGVLSELKITCDAPASGNILLRSIEIADGGDGYPPFTISPEEVVYTFKDRVAKGIGMSPDGILGQWRRDDGKINFMGSNLGKLFKAVGTETDPFETVEYTSGVVEDLPAGEYTYASVAQVYKDPDSGMLLGMTHLEKTDPITKVYVSSIAICTSVDDGGSWQFTDRILSCNLPDDQLPHVSRDAGNGTMLIQDGYLYVYFVDTDTDARIGLAIARAELKDVVEQARQGKAAPFHKWYDGGWTEPGIEGKFSNILTSGDAPNFMYVQYNTVLKKYIMLTCCSPYYQTNDGDIALYISDTFMEFAGPKYHIACGTRGEQYPSMISLEPDSQLTSGKEFYIYYCSWDAKTETGAIDWQKLWGSSNYVRRKITITE